MDEHEAIRRLKQHDLRGLESLVHDHQLEAVRVAMLVTRDRALAEDVVQSSFVRVCEKIGQYDERRTFRPWFLRIVTNAALKAVTRGRRDISYEMLAAGGREPAGCSRSVRVSWCTCFHARRRNRYARSLPDAVWT